jgi:hypothetical protein
MLRAVLKNGIKKTDLEFGNYTYRNNINFSSIIYASFRMHNQNPLYKMVKAFRKKKKFYACIELRDRAN